MEKKDCVFLFVTLHLQDDMIHLFYIISFYVCHSFFSSIIIHLYPILFHIYRIPYQSEVDNERVNEPVPLALWMCVFACGGTVVLFSRLYTQASALPFSRQFGFLSARGSLSVSRPLPVLRGFNHRQPTLHSCLTSSLHHIRRSAVHIH